MKPQTTRTLNPLPFQDLEPHRFEDLVRALAYDFRAWASLEALGRSGDDGGMDIRGIERLQFIDESDQSLDRFDDDDNTVEASSNRAQSSAERLWIFQCKREKSFSPNDVRKAVKESLTGATAPHGFVLAVACDLSKKARDAFRYEMITHGVQEFHAWARGELEDMLFQGKNDRLLFAFFNISLRTRRQSLAASLRSTIALKSRIRKIMDEGNDTDSNKLILLRDPSDRDFGPPGKARKAVTRNLGRGGDLLG